MKSQLSTNRVIGNSDETFAKNLKVAVKLNCTCRARSTLKEGDDIASYSKRVFRETQLFEMHVRD